MRSHVVTVSANAWRMESSSIEKSVQWMVSNLSSKFLNMLHYAVLLTISIKESIFKHSKPYKWDESNSICTHADSKGTSEFLCLLIAGVRGALAKTIKKIEPRYPFMGEMLADCFCGESETGLSKLGFDEDYHRTDFRMLEFIQQAVLEKIDDDEFVDKFVKKEFYLTEYNED